MAKKNRKDRRPFRQWWQRWLGGAVLFVTVIVAVTVLSVRREGQVYHTEPTAEVAAGDRVIVEVLNGCGAGGAARTVARVLREHGFDVVRIGNAEDFGYTHTLVIDRSGARQKASRVARSMCCTRVVTQVADDAFLDVTVILGADGLWRQGLITPGEW
ncbi:MAG: LytR C-terminal domain-containing protein [Candidatus Eisenbacteria sp.]|nr:LytR C-terminal domain-containing protein [Candidatus Eisenbacteria bacterium]